LPVYGLYGGDGARGGATIPASADEMRKAPKTCERVICDEAGYAFMRLGEEKNPGAAY